MNGVRNVPNTVFYCGAEARESVPPSQRHGTYRATDTVYGNAATPPISNTPIVFLGGGVGNCGGVSGYKRAEFTVLVGKNVF